jgi:hypothetical protein
VRTGIPPSVWAEEGERAIVTALELLNPKEADPDAEFAELNDVPEDS